MVRRGEVKVDTERFLPFLVVMGFRSIIKGDRLHPGSMLFQNSPQGLVRLLRIACLQLPDLSPSRRSFHQRQDAVA